jgi:aminopeptidase N
LSQYTERDLDQWSQVWVKEAGMPVLKASVIGNRLRVEESDPWERGLVWPQQLKYRICEGNKSEDVVLEIGDTSRVLTVELNQKYDSPAILPNIDGRGYGFFELNPKDVQGAFACLDTTTDDMLKGSLLITLHENLQNRTLKPEPFLQALPMRSRKRMTCCIRWHWDISVRLSVFCRQDLMVWNMHYGNW